MESIPAASSVAQRLWHIVRAVFYMLRKGISRRKLMLDLHLLLKRGKLAGKVIGKLLHHPHHHQSTAATHDLHFSDCSCLSLDPKNSVQLSCSNTPSYAYYYPHATAKRRTSHRRRDNSYDAAAVAKAMEMFDNESSDAESSAVSLGLLTPSPMLGMVMRTPTCRQLRITDSPFMITEELDGVDIGRIDKEADEFISRFYEQLRRQQLASAAATPEYAVRGRKPVAGRG